MKAYRQGELLFIKVELKDTEREAFIKDQQLLNTTIIREGETTGHKHIAEVGTLYERKYSTINLPDGEMFLTSDNAIKITHQEHKTLELPKGDYVIRVQREYNEERDSKVRD